MAAMRISACGRNFKGIECGPKARYRRQRQEGNMTMASEILNPKTAAWPASLAAAGVLGSWALACVFPLAAIATVAALTMRSKSMVWLWSSGAWAANQFVWIFRAELPLGRAGCRPAALRSSLARSPRIWQRRAWCRLGSASMAGCTMSYRSQRAFAVYLTDDACLCRIWRRDENFTARDQHGCGAEQFALVRRPDGAALHPQPRNGRKAATGDGLKRSSSGSPPTDHPDSKRRIAR